MFTFEAFFLRNFALTGAYLCRLRKPRFLESCTAFRVIKWLEGEIL